MASRIRDAGRGEGISLPSLMKFGLRRDFWSVGQRGGNGRWPTPIFQGRSTRAT
jgi:hypothetical protein